MTPGREAVRRLILGYGYAEETSATHLHAAIGPLAAVTAIGTGHPRTEPNDADGLLWVESSGPQRWLPPGELLLRYPSAAWMIDTHIGLSWRVRLGQAFDHVFVAQKAAVGAFAERGVSTTWLPLAAPSSLLGRGEDLDLRPVDVGFVGRVVPGSPRHAVLVALNERFSVAPAGGFVRPTDMMGAYRRARVVVTLPVRNDLNMRVFEGAAARALVVTPAVPGVEDVLPAGSYIPVEGDDPRCWIDAVEVALASPDRQQRADVAFAAVAGSHTYEHRARTIMEAFSRLEPSALGAEERMRSLAAGYARYGMPLRGAGVPTLSAVGKIHALESGTRWALLRTALDVMSRRMPGVARRLDPSTSAWARTVLELANSAQPPAGRNRPSSRGS